MDLAGRGVTAQDGSVRTRRGTPSAARQPRTGHPRPGAAQLSLPVLPAVDDWRLDEHTCRIGRMGVAQARATLERCRARAGATADDVPPELVGPPHDDREGEGQR